MTGVDEVIARVRAVYGTWRRQTPAADMRAGWDTLFAPLAQHLPPLETVNANGVPAAWVMASGADAGCVLLYLHGGGFRVGSTRSHHRLMHDLSAAGDVRVLGVDYRLVPEARFPAPLDDAWSAWQWLRAQGYQADRIAVGGDSAGGNLALLLMLRLRDAGEALPAAAVLLSPWTDLSASGESFETRDGSDPIHNRAMIQATAFAYLGADQDPAAPEISPLFACLEGLPPMLMQVGDCETVLSDTVAFAERARAAGVHAQDEVVPDMIHVFQQFPDVLPEAVVAIERFGAFLRAHLSGCHT